MQTVTTTVSDPMFDLTKLREQVLDYCKSPSVADKAKAEVIMTTD